MSEIFAAVHNPRLSWRLLAAGLTAAAFIGSSYGQSITVLSGSTQATLTLRTAQSRFLPSKADTAQEALKDTAISAAGQQVAGSVAGLAGGKLLTLPVVGGLPVQGAMAAINVFHKKTVKGFMVDYLLGLGSETTLAQGTFSFNIDTGQSKLQSSGVQLSPPMLLRLQPAAKDFARIIRTTHLSYKEPGGNPLTAETLDLQQDLITCQTESRGGDLLTLIPMKPLEAGEYAVVLPSRTVMPGVSGKEMLALTWDFTVK
ncbi:MAG TPA: hypothetical protein VHY84_08370 [Bryobacteraceae bacterium]|jgi:hypothetical protein|nr:hypothetical protein [Bryobacteraceae bacterium]